jgi:hypothetical protein
MPEIAIRLDAESYDEPALVKADTITLEATVDSASVRAWTGVAGPSRSKVSTRQ